MDTKDIIKAVYQALSSNDLLKFLETEYSDICLYSLTYKLLTKYHRNSEIHLSSHYEKY
jgi:hypothetical protein